MHEQEIEIVVIEDEEDVLELIEYHLRSEGYTVTGFLSAESVEQFLLEENPALLIVDRNLPGIEGSTFVRNIRAQGHDIPVIFLTAKDQESDLVSGFQSGGDDYMTKPFSAPELLLRVKALLRRSGTTESQIIRFRDIKLDLTRRDVWIDGSLVDLSNLEFGLLATFVRNPNQALERDFLRDEVWGGVENFHEKTVNVAINRLKKKIDPDGTKHYFQPIWGVGYKLV
jgi:DNA-binding response OmpR family regulator